MRNWNDREHFSVPHVQNRHSAGTDIGGISPAAVMGEDKHVGLRLTGWDRADNFQCVRVDDADGAVNFGGDIQHAPLRIEDRAVGSNTVTEIDIANDFAGRKIDDDHAVAIGPGFADAGISVDRHIGCAAIRRRGDFMPMPLFSTSRNRSQDLAGYRIDDVSCMIALIHYEQDWLARLSVRRLRVGVDRKYSKEEDRQPQKKPSQLGLFFHITGVYRNDAKCKLVGNFLAETRT